MDNFLYFFISYQKTQKENQNDLVFVVPEKKEHNPECIYSDDDFYDNKQYYDRKIFKVNKSAGKGKKGNNF